MRIQSTTILERSDKDATVEIVVSDAAEIDEANEYVICRMTIPYGDSSTLSKIEYETLEKVAEIFVQISTER